MAMVAFEKVEAGVVGEDIGFPTDGADAAGVADGRAPGAVVELAPEGVVADEVVVVTAELDGAGVAVDGASPENAVATSEEDR